MHEQIKKAMTFAQQKHAAQSYDQYPYFKHLEDVYKVLLRFGFSEDKIEDRDILVAGILHDSLEDTETSYKDLKKEFSYEVAEIVYCDTDELGRNRKEKHEKTYPKTRSNPNSVIIKVADRIANIEHSLVEKSTFIEMYRKEHEEFQKALRIYKHIDDMWEYLNGLIEKKE
jgi:(p)ppGpp synthase/HD superfamily hydrolase